MNLMCGGGSSSVLRSALNAAVGRPVADVLVEVADVVDAGVRRAVDLGDVERAACRDLEAARADAAGLAGRAFGAIERLRQQARDRRLPDAARPGEEERVGDALLRDRVPQRRRDVLLPDDVLEPLGPPLPC